MSAVATTSANNDTTSHPLDQQPLDARPVDSDNESEDPEHPSLAHASRPSGGGNTASRTASGRLTNTTSAEFYSKTVEPRRRAVYDAYGNEVGYNKGLPHKRHPETAAAMDRYISLRTGSNAMTTQSSGTFKTEPSTQEFNEQVVRTQSFGNMGSNNSSPDNATIGVSPSLVLTSAHGTALSPSGVNGPEISKAKPESEVKHPWYERAADKVLGRRSVEKKSRLGRFVATPTVVEEAHQKK